MAFEITPTVLRGTDGSVVGVSLVADGESYSERFISGFPEALRKGEATVTIKGEKVVFSWPTFGRPSQWETRFEFGPTPEELAGLKASIFAKDRRWVIKPYEYALGESFQIILQK